jgi:hypothetical protein
LALAQGLNNRCTVGLVDHLDDPKTLSHLEHIGVDDPETATSDQHRVEEAVVVHGSGVSA